MFYAVGGSEECELKDLRRSLREHGPYVEASRPVRVVPRGCEPPPRFFEILATEMGWELDEDADVELELRGGSVSGLPNVLGLKRGEDGYVTAMRAHAKVFGEPAVPVVDTEEPRTVVHVAVSGPLLSYTVASVWDTVCHEVTGVASAGVGVEGILRAHSADDAVVVRAAPGPLSWVPGTEEASPGGCALAALSSPREAVGETLWPL